MGKTLKELIDYHQGQWRRFSSFNKEQAAYHRGVVYGLSAAPDPEEAESDRFRKWLNEQDPYRKDVEDGTTDEGS